MLPESLDAKSECAGVCHRAKSRTERTPRWPKRANRLHRHRRLGRTVAHALQSRFAAPPLTSQMSCEV
jgi:hypothetical protein